MRFAITHLNYISLIVVTVVGFLLGWLWYGPLFGKPWMAEMKISEEQMKAQMAEKGMAGYMIKGLIFTLLSTFGLVVVLVSHGLPNWKHGAACGMFIGVFVTSMRMLNAGVWENRSLKLQAINAGHEIVLFTLQGAIFGAWH